MELPTELKPFHHQVAGQSLILRYDRTTICKSALSRERQFYQSHPSALRTHIPEFKGVIQMPLPDSMISGVTPNDETDLKKDASDWSKLNRDSPPLLLSPNQMRGLRKSSISGTPANNGQSTYEFVLLEDLVSKFEKPCVLDLKMGTRQHGDDAPAEKVAYQVHKCKNTTSASLGFRLCGMKKFDPASGTFEIKDKKHGRELRESEVPAEISSFLSINGRIRQDISRFVLRRLKQLRSAIHRLDGFRFFSCSILIIYEGSLQVAVKPNMKVKSLENPGITCPLRSLSDSPATGDCVCATPVLLKHEEVETDASLNNENNHKSINVRPMCHTNPTTYNETVGSDENTNECAMSPTECFNENYFQDLDPEINASPIHDHQGNEALYGAINDIQTQEREGSGSQMKSQPTEHLMNNSPHNSSSSSPPFTDQTDLSEDSVEVRVVDFAHATFPGFKGGHSMHTYTGPDQGFLLGLDSLISIVSELLTDCIGNDGGV